MVVALAGIVGCEDKPVWFFSGCALAVGCMTKFYPLIGLPFLCMRKRTINWTFLQGFLAASTLILGLAYSRWGSSIFIPLRFAAERRSKHLSIFHLMRVNGINIDHVSIYAMMIGLVTWFIFYLWKEMDPLQGLVLGYAIVLSLYKVGHPQFFLFFFLVAPFTIRYWMSSFSRRISGRITGAFLVWLSFLNWYQLEYSMTGGMLGWPARSIRNTGSLFYAIISITATVAVVRVLKQKVG
jgi:hypothetical protein